MKTLKYNFITLKLIILIGLITRSLFKEIRKIPFKFFFLSPNDVRETPKAFEEKFNKFLFISND